MKMLLGFDPLLYLDLNDIQSNQKGQISYKILSQLSEYLVVRIAELLTAEQLKTARSPEELFAIAEKHTPDLEKKLRVFLADFKKDFKDKIK